MLSWKVNPYSVALMAALLLVLGPAPIQADDGYTYDGLGDFYGDGFGDFGDFGDGGTQGEFESEADMCADYQDSQFDPTAEPGTLGSECKDDQTICESGLICCLNSNFETLCQDVDECLVSGSCDQICTNTMGSFKCGCEDGFTLADDGVHCDKVEQAQPDVVCDEGYVLNSLTSYCWKLYTEKMTHEEAEDFCHSRDEKLVVIDSESMLIWYHATKNSQPGWKKHAHIWIGGVASKSGKWYWKGRKLAEILMPSEVSQNGWQESEPNNSGKCLQLWRHKLDDAKCNQSHPFMCEKPVEGMDY